MNDGVWILACAALTMLLAGCIQNVLGFGYAMVAMSSLPWMMDIREANVLVAICSLLPLSYGAWECRRDLSWHFIRIAVVGAVIGLPIGLFVFRFADGAVLLRMTGIVILMLVVHGLYQDWRAPSLVKAISAGDADNQPNTFGHQPTTGLAIAGLFSGALAGAIGIGGPPIAAYATNRRWPMPMTRGFLIAVAFAVAALRCIGLVVTGWIGTDEILRCGVAIPSSVVGGVLGVHVAGRIHPAVFRRVTLSVLFLLAIGMIL